MKTTHTILVCIILTISFFSAYAQKQNNIWCFGDEARLNFNSGSPVNDTLCALFTGEGSASIADKNTGQLLFYSDGTSVYNRNNLIMPGNTMPLGGNSTTTQSALIVPMPGSDNEYYLFCVDGQAGDASEDGDSGTQYCIIDMNLDGGLGDVAQQPRRLLTPTCEKISATPMANGLGYWVVVHLWNSDAFYAYPLTATGIGVPVISHAGLVNCDNFDSENAEAIGYMRISPDQTKLAVAI
jgi:hypothetical protein